MTWLADTQQNRPTDEKLEKLLAEREVLASKIATLQMTPLRNSTASAKLGRQEDLLALAKKMKLIDRKLGRSEV